MVIWIMEKMLLQKHIKIKNKLKNYKNIKIKGFNRLEKKELIKLFFS